MTIGGNALRSGWPLSEDIFIAASRSTLPILRCVLPNERNIVMRISHLLLRLLLPHHLHLYVGDRCSWSDLKPLFSPTRASCIFAFPPVSLHSDNLRRENRQSLHHPRPLSAPTFRAYQCPLRAHLQASSLVGLWAGACFPVVAVNPCSFDARHLIDGHSATAICLGWYPNGMRSSL